MHIRTLGNFWPYRGWHYAIISFPVSWACNKLHQPADTTVVQNGLKQPCQEFVTGCWKVQRSVPPELPYSHSLWSVKGEHEGLCGGHGTCCSLISECAQWEDARFTPETNHISEPPVWKMTDSSRCVPHWWLPCTVAGGGCRLNYWYGGALQLFCQLMERCKKEEKAVLWPWRPCERTSLSNPADVLCFTATRSARKVMQVKEFKLCLKIVWDGR